MTVLVCRRTFCREHSGSILRSCIIALRGGFFMNPGTLSLQKRNLAVSWQKKLFAAGRMLDTSIVNDMVTASWFRSRAYGVAPGYVFSSPVPEREFKSALERNRELLKSATPLMEKLFDAISGSRSVIGLADKAGLIIHTVGHEEELKRLIVFNAGYYATEKTNGTNGIGTCLVERKPLEIIGCEHYAEQASGWCCSAAPIMDRKGTLIGVLNVSIELENYHQHTLGMVAAAAHAIGEQLRLRRLLRQQRIMFELIDEGVIFLDSDGFISAWNDKARAMLSAQDMREREDLPNIRELVCESSALDEALASRKPLHDQECTLQLRQGTLQCVLSSSPMEDNSGLLLTLRETRRLRDYAARLMGAKAIYTFDDILGDSPAMRDVLRLGRAAAQGEITTLIMGESGTGKELLAQAIHNASSRQGGPFVAVNCGALPPGLVESELFGYEEGAFTGASKRGKPGKFELADGGTIFLDEIGEMPLDAQAALLRLLQEGELTRVGGTRPRRVALRVIAATNRILADEVRARRFREDLYYRLNVLTIRLPALRERADDLPALALHFLQRFGAASGRKHLVFSPECSESLTRHHWPGNVRELANTIERTIALAEGSVISRLDLPNTQQFPERGLPAMPPGTLRSREMEAIFETLKANGGNMRAAAQSLGIARSALYRKLHRYGFTPDLWREHEETAE